MKGIPNEYEVDSRIVTILAAIYNKFKGYLVYFSSVLPVFTPDMKNGSTPHESGKWVCRVGRYGVSYGEECQYTMQSLC